MDTTTGGHQSAGCRDDHPLSLAVSPIWWVGEELPAEHTFSTGTAKSS